MKKSLKFRKAFTLVEILVVISVIAMLASIVLASLTQAKIKAKNIRIQSEATNIRSQVVSNSDGLYYDLSSNSSFRPIAIQGDIGSSTTNLVNDILAQNGGIYAGGVCSTQVVGGVTIPVYWANSTCGSVSVTNLHPSGLTIFTDNARSGASPSYATEFAIYAAYAPTIGSSGYFCVDSGGTSLYKSGGAMPTATDLPSPKCQ